MIQLTNVSKVYHSAAEQLNILKSIDLTINKSESVAIIGSSGSGKSTLLAIMAGLDLPSDGKVVLAGEDISVMNEDQRAAIRAKYVGFVFQSFHLLPNLTALENVMLALELKKESNAKTRAQELLAQVGLAARSRHYPHQLSGGEQQRVAIARAFACQPNILFADEPTGNLDAKTGETIINLLFELNKGYETSLVLVTHEQRLADTCARRVGLSDGRIITDSNNKV